MSDPDVRVERFTEMDATGLIINGVPVPPPEEDEDDTEESR